MNIKMLVGAIVCYLIILGVVLVPLLVGIYFNSIILIITSSIISTLVGFTLFSKCYTWATW